MMTISRFSPLLVILVVTGGLKIKDLMTASAKDRIVSIAVVYDVFSVGSAHNEEREERWSL